MCVDVAVDREIGTQTSRIAALAEVEAVATALEASAAERVEASTATT